jgi:hypothetical protein
MRDRRDMREIATNTKIGGILRDIRPPGVCLEFPLRNRICEKCKVTFKGPANARWCEKHRGAARKQQAKRYAKKAKARG